MPGMIAVPEGRVRIVADPPTKAERGPSRWRLRRMRGGLAPEIAEALAGARREALLISPYFVPGREGAALLAGLVRRGVRVSVVTNSLAATDVPAVHGGYARYRRRLLEDGVELHEVKHLGPGQTPNRLSRRILGSSGVSLHSKAMVVDGAEGFVGSFNLDPRSAALNTEMGVAVRHPGFAAAIAGEHARLAAPAAAWRVTLEGGRLAWRDGAAWHATEPGASRLRRATAFMAWLLPVEGQL
jgi:putative cardiolipin synthase